MSQTKISIIVPLYNMEKYASRCIDSILKQYYKNFELLLINDGSTDGTADICNQYAKKDDRIIVFHKENGGVSSARNLGLSEAKGEWITFVDADDWIEPGFLSVVELPINSQSELILSTWRTIWNGSILNEIHEKKENELYSGWSEISKEWNTIADKDICRCPWGKFYRHSIIKNHNITFNQLLHYGEDTVFNYQYLTRINSFSICVSPDNHYIFHQNSEQRAVKKYKCTPEGITTARDLVFDIFYKKGLENLKFERLFFFGFTMIEHCYLNQPDNKIRKNYYKGDIQKKMEKRCLSDIRFYDKWMYLLYKYLPHSILSPLSNLYLNYR